MSDLLNSASLVMIPSGYKEDTVYSVVPSDGSGDLSFTRASNGTRVNSAGLVEVVPWNLLQYSEQFQNVVWNKQNSGTTFTLTDNFTTAPNGTTTACKYTWTAMDSAGKYFSIYQPITNSVGDLPVTFSVYLKGALGGEKLYIYGNGGEGIQLLTLTTEWVRYQITFDTVDANILGFIGGEFGASGMTTLAAGTAYVWGAQLNIGSTAKPYFPTTDRLNVPRLTYQNGGGGCPSLLLEKQSTNLVSYSEDFTNAVYTKVEVTASTNATTSPDGTVNGNSIFETTVSSTHESWQRASMTAGQLYTQSCFLKANGRNRVIMQIFDNATQYASAIYDLSTGVVVASVGTATIQSMGNGWYRCTITGTSPATGLGYCVLGLCENTYTNSAVMPTYVGDTAKGVYWWGFQLEASSYPTSYIPTTSSSATRVADACSKTGISSLIGQTEGVVFWDIEVETLSATGNENILNIDAGSFSNTIYFSKASNGSLYAEVYVTGVAQCSFSHSLPSVGRYKMALAYKANDFAFYVNGVSRGTDTSGSVPATSRLQITNTVLGSGDGKTNQAILFPTRLTNAELASLTTI